MEPAICDLRLHAHISVQATAAEHVHCITGTLYYYRRLHNYYTQRNVFTTTTYREGQSICSESELLQSYSESMGMSRFRIFRCCGRFDWLYWVPHMHAHQYLRLVIMMHHSIQQKYLC